MEIQSVAERALAQAKLQNSDSSLVSVSSTMAKEFNIEANRLTLLRTTFDQRITLKSIIDQRQAVTSGNQFTNEALDELTKQTVVAAKASPQDPCYGFTPLQMSKKFSFGDLPIDEGWMYGALCDLLKERAERFPKIIIEGGTIKFVKSNSILQTSTGTRFEATQGHYEGSIMFTAKEGKKSSSFNYISFQLASDRAGKPVSLMQTGSLHELLGQSSQQTEVRKLAGPFVGDLIVTPHCLESFLYGWTTDLSSGQMLKGSSLFKDKLGQNVGSDKFTLTASPIESNFATRQFWTGDGYETQNETIFETGILKTYLLGHYAAKKLGLGISRSDGSYMSVAPGSSALNDMIRSVKKGILMCRESAGRPAENGDVSGVAKNSYYIENGEIRHPLGETMFALNLASALKDIKSISRETIDSGYWNLPWLQIENVSIS